VQWLLLPTDYHHHALYRRPHALPHPLLPRPPTALPNAYTSHVHTYIALMWPVWQPHKHTLHTTHTHRDREKGPHTDREKDRNASTHTDKKQTVADTHTQRAHNTSPHTQAHTQTSRDFGTFSKTWILGDMVFRRIYFCHPYHLASILNIFVLPLTYK